CVTIDGDQHVIVIAFRSFTPWKGAPGRRGRPGGHPVAMYPRGDCGVPRTVIDLIDGLGPLPPAFGLVQPVGAPDLMADIFKDVCWFVDPILPPMLDGHVVFPNSVDHQDMLRTDDVAVIPDHTDDFMALGFIRLFELVAFNKRNRFPEIERDAEVARHGENGLSIALELVALLRCASSRSIG